jgi:hypothetical protein
MGSHGINDTGREWGADVPTSDPERPSGALAHVVARPICAPELRVLDGQMPEHFMGQ